jgi:hypothetical protein
VNIYHVVAFPPSVELQKIAVYAADGYSQKRCKPRNATARSQGRQGNESSVVDRLRTILDSFRNLRIPIPTDFFTTDMHHSSVMRCVAESICEVLVETKKQEAHFVGNVSVHLLHDPEFCDLFIIIIVLSSIGYFATAYVQSALSVVINSVWIISAHYTRISVRTVYHTRCFPQRRFMDTVRLKTR